MAESCKEEGCEKPVRAWGWCVMHYQRWKAHGDPNIVLRGGPRAGDPIARFWAKVNKDGPIPEHRPDLGRCWVWTGTTDKDGYGRFSIRRKAVRPHRFACELAGGPIPSDRQPDHICRNTACVKAIADERGPAHLEVVTPRENFLRGVGAAAINARKTHCIHGHEFTPENTYIDPSGKRGCRKCRNRASYAYKARKP
jgi:hypothetical protein